MTDMPAPMNIAPRVGRTMLSLMNEAAGIPAPWQRDRIAIDAALRICKAAASYEIPIGMDSGAARVHCAYDMLSDLHVAARTSGGECGLPREEDCGLGVLRGKARNWLAKERTARRSHSDIDAERDGDGEDIDGEELAPITNADVVDLPEAVDPDRVDATGVQTAGGMTQDTAMNAADALARELRAPGAAVLIYSVLRDGSSAEVAEDMLMSPAALRKAQQRGREALADVYPTPHALAAALNLVDSPHAGNAHPHVHSLTPDERYSDGAEHPLTHRVRPACRLRMSRAWGGDIDGERWTAPGRTWSRKWQELRAVRRDLRYPWSLMNAERGEARLSVAADHPAFIAAPITAPPILRIAATTARVAPDVHVQLTLPAPRGLATYTARARYWGTFTARPRERGDGDGARCATTRPYGPPDALSAFLAGATTPPRSLALPRAYALAVHALTA